MPNRSARSSTLFSFRAPSRIILTARETTAIVPSQAGVPGDACGRHRLQGRKPADSASAAYVNKCVLSGLANGTAQTFLQYRPVLVAPAKKRPSKRESRL